jgi:hypothetical protein
MFRVPPERVKVLSQDDLQQYGLNEDDPYESAANVAQLAKAFGVSHRGNDTKDRDNTR